MVAKRFKLSDEEAPALRFSPYDAVLSNEEDRWLAVWARSSSGPVWLAHRVAGGGVLVGTLPKRLYGSGESPLDMRAHGLAVGQLTKLVEPAEPVAGHELAGERVLAHVAEQLSLDENWKVVTWTVEGERVSARVFEFAGAWLAITDEVSTPYLAVVGTGMDADKLEICATRGGPYGVDFGKPITIGQRNQLHVGEIPGPAHPHQDLRPFLTPDS